MRNSELKLYNWRVVTQEYESGRKTYNFFANGAVVICIFTKGIITAYTPNMEVFEELQIEGLTVNDYTAFLIEINKMNF